MTESQKVVHELVLVAIGKAFSEQSTYLINELKHEKKAAFNSAVGSIDYFIKTIESKLPKDQKVVLEQLTDDFHELLEDIKKQIQEI